MDILRRAATALVVVACWPAAAWPQLQSSLNPEISFIAQTRAVADSEEEGDVAIEFEELEVAAQGFLNPFARASVFVGIHDGSIEVEEAYVTFITLPAHLGLRAGRYRVDVGRFLPQHTHTLPFLDYPAFVAEYFTDEGLSETGINPSILVDVGGIPLTVSTNVLSGMVEDHDHDAAADSTTEQSEEHAARSLRDLTYTGRASLFFELAPSTNVEIAGHGGTRVLDVEEGRRSAWFGGDYKLKWRPHRRTSFVLAGEVIVHRADLEPEAAPAAADLATETALGAFQYVDYQFARKWNAGALIDYAQHAENADERMLGLGLFAGYSMFEESTVIRVVGRRDDFSDASDPAWSLHLRLVFGLGPHKPHQF